METVTIATRCAVTTREHVALLAASVVCATRGRLVAIMGFVLGITQLQQPGSPFYCTSHSNEHYKQIANIFIWDFYILDLPVT
ncbi:uncharacterized protein K444DRAFT_177176 [Hyaloscypha bicolor E]|uniref:Uncharacterized protein n=1 Tax=Hyaloscypha bicolor E TaxID=1095630 RepID=A0A2J6TQS9_9HELO|nr:uncharacterized protein K444DRAFT_177176 [Hyaloscypha bicolor E]PMD65308.1 hypothetical protein K444DRAFT_177176 [Hyaloscypha bicolor E]